MIQAAALPAVAITADLALKKADEFLKSSGADGLKGKTVFIPGALSGVGSVALQIAKREWNCHTITAASTSKIPQITSYLGEDVVDIAHDYTQLDVTKAVGTGAVDFVFDTTGLAADYLPMIKRGGLCLSIARLPPGSALKSEDPDAPAQSRLACIGQNVMDGMDAAFRTWARTRYGVTYQYQRTVPVSGDLEAVSRLVEEGKVRAVVGRTTSLGDVEGVREGCMGVFKGKGQVGKFVITMEDGK
jgi:NADPH:quinone reductase-like Zn-dependent oxidoreductase